MAPSRKNVRCDVDGFSQIVIDRVIKTLDVKPSDKHIRSDGSVTTVEDEIQQRLNSIKILFNHPERFDDWVAPAKMKKLIEGEHRKLLNALDVLRSLSGPIGVTTKTSKQPNLVKRWLYEASEGNHIISAGLVGHDVVTFDKNFSMAIESLEKIEGYFSAVLTREEVVVRGRGETKSGNAYADNLLGCLSQLYKDVTGQTPIAWVDDIEGTVRGQIVRFLQVVLREMPYPYKTTLTALEKKVRGLKSHKTYAHLWEDAKR